MQYSFTTFHNKKLTCCSDGKLYNDSTHNGTGNSDAYFTVETINGNQCRIRTQYGYVTTDRNCNMSCKGNQGDEGAVWTMKTVRNNVLAFQGAFGKWFSATTSGSVICNGPKQDTWEELTITQQQQVASSSGSGSGYTFRSFHNKKLTCCDDGRLYNDSNHTGSGNSDEWFNIETINGSQCRIRTKYGYVTTDRNCSMTCRGNQGDEGAVWTMKTVRSGVLAFQGAFGKWFSATTSGSVVCDGPKQDTWEELTITQQQQAQAQPQAATSSSSQAISSGQYTFKSFHNKKLTCCEDGKVYNDSNHTGSGNSDEWFTVEITSGSQCRIKTKYGYVTTDRNCNMTCKGNQGDEGAVWTMKTVRSGVLAFQGAFGKWFSATTSGSVVCNGPKQDTWEELTITQQKQAQTLKPIQVSAIYQYSFTTFHNKVLTSCDDGKLYNDNNHNGTGNSNVWFIVEPVNGNQCRIKSVYGYITVDRSNIITCKGSQNDQGAIWKMYEVNNNVVAFESALGKWLSPRDDGSVTGSAPEHDTWENITIKEKKSEERTAPQRSGQLVPPQAAPQNQEQQQQNNNGQEFKFDPELLSKCCLMI